MGGEGKKYITQTTMLSRDKATIDVHCPFSPPLPRGFLLFRKGSKTWNRVEDAIAFWRSADSDVPPTLRAAGSLLQLTYESSQERSFLLHCQSSIYMCCAVV